MGHLQKQAIAFFVAAWALLALLAPSIASARVAPPQRPAGNFFIQDYAMVLRDSERKSIGAVQQRAFEQHQTPIIVVTIPQMRTYSTETSIEAFAREWFDRWKIGTGRDNKGILLLLSIDDRKARIELGADWGRSWDDRCAKIMSQTIVPNCKKGDYAGAISGAVEELAKMAELGPSAAPPTEPLMNRLTGGEPLTSASKIPGGIGIVMIVCGAGLFLFAIFKMPHGFMRTVLMIVAGLLILLPLISWIFLVIGALTWGKSGRSSGGGYSSGGGFSGGSSGGGGASGSW